MNIQFSLRTMLILVAATSISLALTRVHFLIGGGAMIIYVMIVAIFDGDPYRKRSMIYGAVGGSVMFVIVAASFAPVFGEVPLTSNNFTSDSLDFIRKYAFPIGGFVGAMVGLIFADVRKKPQRTEIDQ